MQVYIVDIEGHKAPKELTSGEHGATTSPVFNYRGTKVAWLQMDKDGFEADRLINILHCLTLAHR
jgi:hypothetical protein